MVSFQSVQSILQTGGQLAELCLLLVAQMVQVEVVGTPAIGVGIDLVLHTVQTCHQNGCIAEVGVAGSVGVPQLKAALVGTLSVSGNTDDCASVGGSVAYGYRCFKAGYKALEGVGAGVGDGAQGGNMLQDTAHKVVGSFT